jgi:protein-disulfide isomerase
MASRTEQKAAARAAREARQRELRSAAARRQRLMMLGGALAAAVTALIVIIVVSSSGSSSGPTSVHLSKNAKAQAVAKVDSELAGIPQSGDVLGNPKAPVTITEYGDLVCPVCDDFALTSEPQIIASLVKTGKAKLVYRGFETASADANGAEYVNTQVAARSAGLQGKEWNYVLLMYQEQPATIGGKDAELVSYINMTYLQNIAAQIKGLNLVQWQAHMTDSTLISDVSADGNAVQAAGASGTPTVIVTGPGTNQPLTAQEAVPSLASVAALVQQAT